MPKSQKKMNSKFGKGRSKRRSKTKGISGLTTISRGIRDRFFTTMTFANYGTSTPAASNWSQQVFRANSLYDPDFTGIGTTALAFPQLAALYYRYRVLGCKITVETMNTGTLPIYVGLSAGIANGAPNAIKQWAARHMARSMICPGGPQGWTHTAYARTAKIFGVPESQVTSEDDFAGLNTGNPNNVWYYHLTFDNSTGPGAGAVTWAVRMVFDVVWSMPLDLTY